MSSYNYDFVCTYKDVEEKCIYDLHHPEKKEENLVKTLDKAIEENGEPSDSDEDEENIYFLCEEIYRIEFIKCFNLEDFDDNIINAQVKNLFDLCKGHEEFSRIIELVKNKTGYEDLEICFMQLFSYELFYLTHDCIGKIHNRLPLDAKVVAKFNFS
jgi:hypothetical protein